MAYWKTNNWYRTRQHDPAIVFGAPRQTVFVFRLSDGSSKSRQTGFSNRSYGLTSIDYRNFAAWLEEEQRKFNLYVINHLNKLAGQGNPTNPANGPNP